jgi:hypothetical protein
MCPDQSVRRGIDGIRVNRSRCAPVMMSCSTTHIERGLAVPLDWLLGKPIDELFGHLVDPICRFELRDELPGGHLCADSSAPQRRRSVEEWDLYSRSAESATGYSSPG